MIHRLASLILPLMHHLMQQRRNGFLPTMPPNVTPAYHDLGAKLLLAAQRVMPEPPLHPPRHANRNVRKLTTELRRIELPMRTREITHIPLIIRMRPLPGSNPRNNRTRRLEIERELPRVKKSS